MSAVRARALRTATEIAWDLANNIAHGVRWYEATTVLRDLGCNLFVEVPPGQVLTNLAKQSIPQVRCIALAENSLSYIVQQAVGTRLTKDADQKAEISIGSDSYRAKLTELIHV